MLVHSDNINGALQQVLQESPQANHKIHFRLHVYTHVDITRLTVLATRYRAEQSERFHTESSAKLIGVCPYKRYKLFPRSHTAILIRLRKDTMFISNGQISGLLISIFLRKVVLAALRMLTCVPKHWSLLQKSEAKMACFQIKSIIFASDTETCPRRAPKND